mgnify:CR=1 FL=1|tara:strand:- start:1181 stop:1801 length:621 start_codon:yes stop_codon:yes gene_type:complete
MKKLKSLQEIAWSKKIGTDYTIRSIKFENRYPTIGKTLVSNKIKVNSILELGCNVGFNLKVLKKIYPRANIVGVEINKAAYEIAKKNYNCLNESLIYFKSSKKFDLVITSGVLIHQSPKLLKKIYKNIYNLSKKYIYIDEYFNPTPVKILYRNKKNLLFKRDFAKDIWNMYPNLKLVNYGFYWNEDPKLKSKPNIVDNSNWFIFKK